MTAPILTCEAAGVCRNPAGECKGACELPPRLPALDGAGPLTGEPDNDPNPTAPLTLFCESLATWLAIAAVTLVTLVCVCGIAGYLYAKHMA